ncbi:hypothetical protein G6549_09170 [Bacillus sp. MM2020_1]|nr:hypothetical protein [Bacillus sp. MM2020_1]
MCQKPMKFTLHQMERERKATLKAKNQPQKFLKKVFNTIGIGMKSKAIAVNQKDEKQIADSTFATSLYETKDRGENWNQLITTGKLK